MKYINLLYRKCFMYFVQSYHILSRFYICIHIHGISHYKSMLSHIKSFK